MGLKFEEERNKKIVLHTHMQIHAEHNDTMKTSDTVFLEIYLSLYLKGLCV